MTIAEVERTAKYLRDGNMLQRCPAGAMEVLRQDLQSAGLREAAELLRRFVSCYCDLAAERNLLIASLQEAARSDYEAWKREHGEVEVTPAEVRLIQAAIDRVVERKTHKR